MKAKLALVVAIVLGVVAAVGVHNYLKKQRKIVVDKIRPTAVLAYAKRLTKGAVIVPRMIRKRDVAQEAITDSTVLLRNRNSVFGQRLVRDVETNQFVQWEDFEEPKVELDRNELRPGYRAITLGVDNVTGVAGNVRPGSHVDIFGAFQLPAEGGRRSRSGGTALVTKTALLLSDVIVLATDNRTTMTQYSLAARRPGASYSSVTVAATPREALMLIHAQATGKITLALRPQGDVIPIEALSEAGDTPILSLAREVEAARRRKLGRKPSSLSNE